MKTAQMIGSTRNLNAHLGKGIGIGGKGCPCCNASPSGKDKRKAARIAKRVERRKFAADLRKGNV